MRKSIVLAGLLTLGLNLVFAFNADAHRGGRRGYYRSHRVVMAPSVPRIVIAPPRVVIAPPIPPVLVAPPPRRHYGYGGYGRNRQVYVDNGYGRSRGCYDRHHHNRGCNDRGHRGDRGRDDNRGRRW